MFSFALVIFQFILIIMIGAFYRSKVFTNLTDLDFSQLASGLVVILGFVLMNATYRKLSLFSLLLLLFITFLSIEINFLMFDFWKSCFTTFQKAVDITTQELISSVFISLGVMITCLDFIGLFEYWQIYAIIAVVMTIGSSLVQNIVFMGLDTFDGGFSIGTFLFSGVCSLMIWMLSVRGKINVLDHKKSESYINYTLGFVGVAITFFSWPGLNVGGSSFSKNNTSLTSQFSLNQSAYVNTFAALGVPLLISTFLSSHQTKSDRLHPRVYIQCFINAGIVVSSFADVSLHPVCGMTMALFSTIITLLVNKYLVPDSSVRNQTDIKIILMKFSKILFRILWSFISVSIGAIVVVTRKSSVLGILVDDADYGKKAGLMVAGWIIGLIISAIFGAICAVIVNYYITYRITLIGNQRVVKITDQLFFTDLEPQIFPIYLTDIAEPQPSNSYQQDLTRRVLQQSLLQQQQVPLNIYETNKKSSSHETEPVGKVQKETLIIKNDFSKSNLHNVDKKEINLSAMKFRNEEEPIAEEIQKPVTSLATSRNNVTVKPVDTPIKILDQSKSRYYESQLPQQSRAQNPKILNTNPSSSKLGNIYVIEEESNQKKGPNNPDMRKKLTFSDGQIENERVSQQGVNRINT